MSIANVEMTNPSSSACKSALALSPSESFPICLAFDPGVGAAIRARMSYAFRVFAAIYNHAVVEENAGDCAIRCFYSAERPKDLSPSTIWVPARYQPGVESELPPVVTKHRRFNEDFCLIFGLDEPTDAPDWLAEVFMWISSRLELSIKPRDSVGRIPYSEMIIARQQIPARKPHAAMMMAWLEHTLRKRRVDEPLPKAPSPAAHAEHLVVCSHDIDVYLTSMFSRLVRLLKNLGIAALSYKSWSFFRSNCEMLGKILTGERVADYLPRLVAAASRWDFHSTVFIASTRLHRRDPAYTITTIAERLQNGAAANFYPSLHGSYTSVLERRNLAREVQALQAATGVKPTGNRQHWLRFDAHEKLFRAVQDAQLAFDSSLGFYDMNGFRNGASFAFPPYDFQNEKPHEFLEIPLVIMDGGLEAEARRFGSHPQSIADEVLRESRKWGWGGVSVLWHNPIEAIQVPVEVNDVLWESLKRREQYSEKWLSADEFIACSLKRYQNAGLLKEVPFDPARGADSSSESASTQL